MALELGIIADRCANATDDGARERERAVSRAGQPRERLDGPRTGWRAAGDTAIRPRHREHACAAVVPPLRPFREPPTTLERLLRRRFRHPHLAAAIRCRSKSQSWLVGLHLYGIRSAAWARPPRRCPGPCVRPFDVVHRLGAGGPAPTAPSHRRAKRRCPRTSARRSRSEALRTSLVGDGQPVAQGGLGAAEQGDFQAHGVAGAPQRPHPRLAGQVCPPRHRGA